MQINDQENPHYPWQLFIVTQRLGAINAGLLATKTTIRPQDPRNALHQETPMPNLRKNNQSVWLKHRLQRQPQTILKCTPPTQKEGLCFPIEFTSASTAIKPGILEDSIIQAKLSSHSGGEQMPKGRNRETTGPTLGILRGNADSIEEVAVINDG